MAFIHSPARDAGSENGLDQMDWAERMARAVASAVRLVYIEAEFFGGTGNQAAVGFQLGCLVRAESGSRVPAESGSQPRHRRSRRQLSSMTIARIAIGEVGLPRSAWDGCIARLLR
jgi:hypothetical protein